MNTLVSEKIVNSFLNEKQFYKEFKAMLNDLIEQELAKETYDMDCDLIEDCTNMLIELEQEQEDGFPVIIPATSAKKIIKACTEHRGFKSLSRGMQASVVACIMLLSAVSANAAVYQFTGHNVAQEVAESINEKLVEWGIISYANNELIIDEIPTGPEDHDAGFEEDDDETTKPVTTAPTSTTDNHKTDNDGNGKTTTAPAVTGPEDHDAGFEDDDDETTKPTTAVKPTLPAVKQFTVTFDTDGGNELEPITVSYRRPIGELPIPEKEGYLFAGWFNIDIAFTFKRYSGLIPVKEEIPITADMLYSIEKDATFTAKWVKPFTITLDADDGICEVTQLKTDAQGKITKLPVPTKDGFVFNGWYYYNKLKKEFVTTNTVFTKDTTIYADYIEDVRDFKMFFNANGGKCDEVSRPIVYDEAYGTLPVPTRAGYTFIGWYKSNTVNSEQITESTVHGTRSNLIVYALWAEDIYTIHFDTAVDGMHIDDTEAYFGQQFGTLPEPEREGYEFLGWYYDDEHIDNGTSVPELADKEMTLTAKWAAAQIEITFDGCGGEVEKWNKSYFYMTPYGELPTATARNHMLEGWFTEDGTRIFETDLVEFSSPATLYAHWVELDNCAGVTVHTNRSIDEAYDINYEIGDTLGELPIPEPTTSTEKQYTIFLGWFDDPYYGNEVTADTVLTGDMDIYAHWGLGKIPGIQIDLEITNLNEVYLLNDELDINTLSATLDVTGSKTVDLTEMIQEDGAEVHFIGADTSTLGKHTLTFRMAYSQFSIVGLGTIYMETTADYLVVNECYHPDTHLEKYSKPSCIAEGYSGDSVCDKCGKTISYGTVLEIVPHEEYVEKVTVGKKAATCTQDGYTGDIKCKVCKEILEEGTVIPKINHKDTELRNVMEPTCTEDGYTGDDVCIYCKEIINKGTDIPRLPHNYVSDVKKCEPSCAAEGYTGDTACSECGKILIHGKSIDKLPHAETILVGQREATCARSGYTGDEVCSVCYEVMSEGETIEKLPHNYIPDVGKVEATCSKSGYTGNTACSECGKVLVYGRSIAKLPHAETTLIGVKEATCRSTGYTGVEICVECGEAIAYGTEIPMHSQAEHKLINVKQATCSENGYTGDEICCDCGTVLTKGEQTDALKHSVVYQMTKASLHKDGFYGSKCRVCGAITSGGEIKAIDTIALECSTYYYTGMQFTPTIIVTDTDGNEISSYNVEMPEYRTNVGVYTIWITFNGYYEGTFNLTFEIKPRTGGITAITKTPSGYCAWWEPVEGADGYEIKVVGPYRVYHQVTRSAEDTSYSFFGFSYAPGTYVTMRSFKKVTVDGKEQTEYSDWSEPYNIYN